MTVFHRSLFAPSLGLIVVLSSLAKTHFVLTDDLATALVTSASAIPQADLPVTLNVAFEGTQSPYSFLLDLLWLLVDLSGSRDDLAKGFSQELGRPIVAKLPFPGMHTVMWLAGYVNHFANDMYKMVAFANSGKVRLLP